MQYKEEGTAEGAQQAHIGDFFVKKITISFKKPETGQQIGGNLHKL